MITYVEKGAGLHRAIHAAGYWLVQQDGVWISNDDAAVQALIDGYSLEQAIALRQGEILEHAKKLRDKSVEGVSVAEMASWPLKQLELEKFERTGSSTAAPILAVEATRRGISLAAMMTKVKANANNLLSLEAHIAGVSGKHRDALAACKTFEQVLAYDWSADWPEV